MDGPLPRLPCAPPPSSNPCIPTLAARPPTGGVDIVTNLPADQRRALELLASSENGCTEAIMVAHGFGLDVLVEVVRAGLATAHGERVRAGGKTVEVLRVQITGAGTQALLVVQLKEGAASAVVRARERTGRTAHAPTRAHAH
jgi:hypothetical protein